MWRSTRPRAILGLLIAATMASCDSPVSPVSPPENMGAPCIHVPETNIALEDISLGTNDVDFEIHNRGDAELRLHGIETSCGCTDASVADSNS
jgi:hypothetical protein